LDDADGGRLKGARAPASMEVGDIETGDVIGQSENHGYHPASAL